MKTIVYCLILLVLIAGCSTTLPTTRTDEPDSTEHQDEKVDEKAETLKFLVVGCFVLFIYVELSK